MKSSLPAGRRSVTRTKREGSPQTYAAHDRIWRWPEWITSRTWMINPTKHPRETPGEPYTCPEYTRGGYYSGPTRVSLVDTQTHRVINTVKILTGESEGEDEFDLPYNIRSDFYYHVEGVPKESEGKPTIMWLKDYNGDGRAVEFALFIVGSGSKRTARARGSFIVGNGRRSLDSYRVSIHAPARGATSISVANDRRRCFDPRPCARGDSNLSERVHRSMF